MTPHVQSDDPRIAFLTGGRRPWWDTADHRMIDSCTLYIPYGCPDWGETRAGTRNELCQFCGLPNSVIEYRKRFYEGRAVPQKDLVDVFARMLADEVARKGFHTLMIFNAGSFLDMPSETQRGIFAAVTRHGGIKRVVIESRARLVSEEKLRLLISVLEGKKHLTIRIGVESEDDHLRLKVLKKGHSRAQLERAAACMRLLGVTSGGYALLNPAPGLDPRWAIEEAIRTINWILDSEGLGMDEAYLGPTCISPNTALARLWEAGRFNPPNLSAVLEVLQRTLGRYTGKVHLLQFKDEPPFVAVPSNHSARGVPQSLDGAQGCDWEYHRMFDGYRETMNPAILRHIPCYCRPKE